MSDVLKAEPRERVGKLHNRRLRAGGRIPAVLYGHGEGSVNLALSRDQLRVALRHNARLVELKGAAKGQALLQELQWDAFGRELLHVDLLRVQAGDVVSVEVPIDLKGEAPGEREGGIVNIVLHEIEVEAPPDALPERLHVDVSELELGGSLTTEKIIDLPEKAKLLVEPDTVLVTCEAPVEEPEEEAAVAEPGEPEMVGRGEQEEGEEEAEGES